MAHFRSTSTFVPGRNDQQVHDLYFGPNGIHAQVSKFRAPLELSLNSVNLRRREEERKLVRQHAALDRDNNMTDREREWLYTEIAISLHTIARLADEEASIRKLYASKHAQEGRTSGLFWNQCYIDSRGLLRIL